MGIIFQEKSFDLPAPKFIIVLEGGLNNNHHERVPDFNEKQLSASMAKLLLDIGLCSFTMSLDKYDRSRTE